MNNALSAEIRSIEAADLWQNYNSLPYELKTRMEARGYKAERMLFEALSLVGINQTVVLGAQTIKFKFDNERAGLRRTFFPSALRIEDIYFDPAQKMVVYSHLLVPAKLDLDVDTKLEGYMVVVQAASLAEFLHGPADARSDINNICGTPLHPRNDWLHRLVHKPASPAL